MAVRYTRQFRFGDKGPDVEGVGRALTRSKTRGNTNYYLFTKFPESIRRTWGSRKQKDLKRFKQKHGLTPDYAYTAKAHAKLSPYFDSKARKLMNSWEPPHPYQTTHWNRLMAAMLAVHKQNPGYFYGGEHDGSIDDDLPTGHFDCSSSCSYVLHKAGMFPYSHAIVSGEFEHWGEPGPGQWFTVYCNEGHVWIRLNHARIWWRFDTSPYGDSKSRRNGARLRFTPRPTWGFTARHWKGM